MPEILDGVVVGEPESDEVTQLCNFLKNLWGEAL